MMSNLLKRLASSVVLMAIMVGIYFAPLFWQQMFVAGLMMICYQEWQKCARLTPEPMRFLAIGAVYILASMAISLFNITHQAQLFWALIAMVVATDCLAFVFGRLLRGPKIAVSISPSKTYSGLIGGMIGSVLIGQILIEYQLWKFDRNYAMGLAMVVALLAQAGDFLESYLKRQAQVKDSGVFIPGHGGVLDRFDGHLMAQLIGVFWL